MLGQKEKPLPKRPAVTLCAVLSEPGSTELLENLPLTSYVRHPVLYTLHPSLDFRHTRNTNQPVKWSF